MDVAIVWVALIAYAGFRQWLQHQRRMMMHRERIAAIEKGVPLPPVEAEVRRKAFNMRPLLLLMGLIWLSIGIGAFVLISVVLSYPPSDATREIPQGAQYIGIIPAGIGLAHLITYLAGMRPERTS